MKFNLDQIKNSFKAKLILLLLAVLLIPMLIVNYAFIDRSTDHIEGSVKAINLKLAESLEKEINSVMRETQVFMETLAQSSTVKEMKANNSLDDLLTELVSNHQAISKAHVIDKSGMQIYKTTGSLKYKSEQEYFEKAMNGEANLSDVMISNGDPIIVAAVPIKKGGEVIGVLAADLDLSFLSKLAEQTKAGKTGYAYIVNSKGKFIAHPDQDLVKQMYDGSNLKPVKKVIAGESGSNRYTFEGQEKLASYVPVEVADWGIIVQLPAKEAFQQIKAEQKFVGLVLIAVIIFSVAIAIWLGRYITNPLRKAVNFAQKIADGKLNAEQITHSSNDEFGKLVSSLNEMRDNLREVIVSIRDNTEDISAYSEELSASAQEGNATIETNNQLIEDMSASIQQISASAQEVSSFAQESATKTEVGEKNIKETVASIKEINEAVDDTVEIINDLDENSNQIGEIIELINNIAEQTNLLALNAAIEAARAGEHGQGFAVVAEEIRELAEDTSKATDDIASLINNMQAKSENGLEAIKEVEEKAQHGEEVVRKTGKVFAEIKESSQETSTHIQQTASSTENLAKNSEEIREASSDIQNMSEDITASSEEMANMAQKLQALVDEFKV